MIFQTEGPKEDPLGCNGLNAPGVKARVSTMMHKGRAPSSGLNADVHHGAPGGTPNRIPGLDQRQWFGGHQNGRRKSISATTVFKRAPREGVNQNSSGTHGCERTPQKVGGVQEDLQILNRGCILADSSMYICVLQECIKMKDLAKGKQVHAHIIQCGFDPNLFLLNTLVKMYAKCGSMVDARRVFEKMLQRDLFTWTIMIAGYARHGYGEEALKIYGQMIRERVIPDKVTFVCVLNACARLRALQKGSEVHADIIKAAISPDIILETALADMYAKCGSLRDARQVFDNMSERNVVSWNAMIAGYSQHGYSGEAFKIFDQMIHEGVTPDRVTFTCILNACASLGDLEKGKGVHAHIIKAGSAPDVILETALVDMYAKCGSMQDARKVFDNMAKRNVVSWNAMTAGYAQHGFGREAFEIYEQMIDEGVTPDKVTFICVLNACAHRGALEKGKEIHADIIIAGIATDSILETALVNMYAKCGSMKDASEVFANMVERDVVSWSTMIAGYAQLGCGKEAFHIYDQMIQKGVIPNKVTFISILNACASLAAMEKGKEVHADIVKAGIVPDIILETVLVETYAKCGSIKDARRVFDNMAERNVRSWNAMIAGYGQHGWVREAFDVYEQMTCEGVMPDRVTFICILNVCASIGSLEKGIGVHADIIKAGIASYINLENTLLDMYAKCGSIKDARQVFDNIADRNVVSWTAMVAAYAQHGCGMEALEIYEQMNQEGVTPNNITFICVLHACASLAALEKGKGVHADIIKAGIAPDIILETALADMYSKCGSIQDARRVFDSMPQRNVVSWNVMIGGYAQQGLGKEALQLFEEMQNKGFKPDVITFICLLCACSHVGLVDEGCHYFDSMRQDYGLTPTVGHFGCMVDLLGRGGRLNEAQDFINKMPIEPDGGVWGALLGACRIHDNVDLAEYATKCLLEWDRQHAPTYVQLSNVYGATYKWENDGGERGAKRARTQMH